jgi:hypothetical protein
MSMSTITPTRAMALRQAPGRATTLPMNTTITTTVRRLS